MGSVLLSCRTRTGLQSKGCVSQKHLGCICPQHIFPVFNCLCSFAHLNLFFLLAFSQQICHKLQHPKVASSLLMLTLVFGCYCLMNTQSQVFVLLHSCVPQPPTHFSVLVRSSLHCSMKGVVHSMLRYFTFPHNFSHRIAFISKNINRLVCFQRCVLSFQPF